MEISPKTNYKDNDRFSEGSPCPKCNNIMRYKLNNACVYCVSQRSKRYHEKVKNTDEYKTKKLNNTRKYRISDTGKDKTKDFNSRSPDSRHEEWVKAKDARYFSFIKRKYNLTMDQYNLLLSEQNNSCKICGDSPTNKRLVVDHCHNTSEVRGLLCNSCNIGLGMFSDNLQLLEKAILYIINNGK